MMTDLHNSIEVRPLIYPQNPGSGDTAIVSQIIDLANRTQAEFVLATGSLSDSNATFTVLVEDGDDSSLADNVAVADAYLLGIEGVAATPTGASFRYDTDNKVRKIGYIGPKRYVRITVTPSGNTGDVFIAGVAILAGARVGPRSSQAA